MIIFARKKSSVVLDASVVAKSFLPEENPADINDIVSDETEAIAPSIIKFEIASLLAKHHRLGNLAAHEAKMMLEAWNRYIEDEGMLLAPSKDYQQQAFALACDLKHPFYDCCYLALAQSYNCPLITADKQLYERGKATYSNIILVS